MKAKLNYWIDVAIALAFLLSALSGVIFLFPVAAASAPLGVGLRDWSRIHTWSSLALMAGVLAHLLLHARWIVSMTRRVLLPRSVVRRGAASAPCTGLSRRQFIGSALAVLAAGAATAGCAALLAGRRTDSGDADAGVRVAAEEQDEYEPALLPSPTLGAPPTPPPAPTQPPVEETVRGVACPRGVVYDPYPGRCGRYTDRDGDGICDFSVPGSGAN